MRTIIVATDGSACADRAVDVAAGLAKSGGGSLLILTVGGNASRDEVRAIAKAEGSAPEALDLIVNRILVEARKRATAIGLEAVSARKRTLSL
jgi:nucleotide-binding universal stress UspA family protein